MDGTTTDIVVLFVVVGLGLSLGKLAWKGISLGTSGVVFVGLAAGAMGFQVPRIAGLAGIILFAYCLGIGAGPSFMRVYIQKGRYLAILAFLMIFSSSVSIWIIAKLFHLPPDLAVGLLGGALTSTPALAAATDVLPPDAQTAVGFGIAYPFGVIGVILFVQLAPRIYKSFGEFQPSTNGEAPNGSSITRVLVHVNNPSVTGKRIRDIETISNTNCQVSRLLVGEALQPIPATFCLEQGQHVLVVGDKERITEAVEVLGETCHDKEYVREIEQNNRRVVVTSREILGKSLKELHLLSRFGVTIARIMRQDVEFVPSSKERIQFGDALIAIGNPQGLEEFVEYAGHRERTLDETDLISLSAGLVAGVLLGCIKFTFLGKTLSLGMAGGPLLAGLILSIQGRIGPFVGHMPRAARFFMAETGLALFLAQAGSQAGDRFFSVIYESGPILVLATVLIVLIPLVIGLLIARFLLRLNILEALGGICGAMTSTPGLGVVTSTTDSSLPVTSYATVYPLALIMITILVPMLISIL